jgi:hypothetical protein
MGVTGISGVTRVFQRRDEIFLALAFESFLRCFETCHAGHDFFPLGSGVVQLFGHAHPFDSPDSHSAPIGGRDWGANWEIALRHLQFNAHTGDRAAALKTSADVNEIERLINEIENPNASGG